MTVISHPISHPTKTVQRHYWACCIRKGRNRLHPDAARTSEKRRVTARNTWSVPPASTRCILMATAPTLLSIRQTQERLGVSRSTTYRLIDIGDLQRLYIRTSPRITESSVIRYLERQALLGDAGKATR